MHRRALPDAEHRRGVPRSGQNHRTKASDYCRVYSYFGLLFLVAAYTSIGIFTSTLSENQIVSFILSVFLCFLFYYGFEGMTTLVKSQSDVISRIGMDYHFKSMARGVIDTRDVLYFLSVAFLFLSLTVINLKSLKS